MRELSLHILDIVQNSITAGATIIFIRIDEDTLSDSLVIRITDNGQGIPAEILNQITDPFFTSRKTRAVGLGLSLLADSAKRAEGDLTVKSTAGIGTEVIASFRHSHIDRPPMGDIQATLVSGIVLNPKIDFVYCHVCGERQFRMDTREFKRELGGFEINQKPILAWLREFIEEGLEELYGGMSQ